MVLLWSMLVFGTLEIVSNLYHLSKTSVQKIGSSARRQHQELPSTASEGHYVVKTGLMLFFGVLFAVASAMALFFDARSVLVEVSIGAFGLYGILQALFYFREIKVWFSAAVYNVFVLLYFFVD